MREKILNWVTPNLISDVVYGLGKIVPWVLSVFFLDYTISMLFISNRIADLPSILMKPFSKKYAKRFLFVNDIENALFIFFYYMKHIIFISIPFIIFIMVFKSITIKTFLSGFNISKIEMSILITALLIFTIESPFRCGLDIIKKLLCSIKRTSVLITVSLLCFGINIVISSILGIILHHIGIVIGIAISTIINYIILVCIISKNYIKYYKMASEFFTTIYKCTFSSLIAVSLVWLFYGIIFNNFQQNIITQIFSLLSCILSYIAIYCLINKLINLKEQKEIISFFKNKQKEEQVQLLLFN